jgi:hypothetical protein
MPLRPGQIDHTERGLADLPERLKRPRISKYLSVYLRQFNSVEELAWSVIDAFLQWESTGSQYDFVLDTIGTWLNQPRPEGFSNPQYAFILKARTLVRQSKAVRDDVIRVAEFLAQGNPVYVFGIVPKTMIIVFVNLVLTPQETALYQKMLLDTIDAVDGLEVSYVTTAVALYDIGLYDEDLYGP